MMNVLHTQYIRLLKINSCVFLSIHLPPRSFRSLCQLFSFFFRLSPFMVLLLHPLCSCCLPLWLMEPPHPTPTCHIYNNSCVVPLSRPVPPHHVHSCSMRVYSFCFLFWVPRANQKTGYLVAMSYICKWSEFLKCDLVFLRITAGFEEIYQSQSNLCGCRAFHQICIMDGTMYFETPRLTWNTLLLCVFA